MLKAYIPLKGQMATKSKNGLTNLQYAFEMGDLLMYFKSFQQCEYNIVPDEALISLIKSSLVMSDATALDVSKNWEP
jgi:hypothetical protein